ncbi:MAG: Asp-tRNA(Asn)/Glu-tRNA(Gln) amidotransferase subunit GatB [Lachnospiraceae bacterium]|nr:Asp-tRNA(Asn)/Glu-tRNA(Gln) amidotransferase subunit GatB [Lachnospiraceae bacterium]
MSKTAWETVIGLEVHAELLTGSKIFCSCATSFGDAPNTLVCPICSGMPGTLPKLNQSVVEYAIRLGLVLNCEITKNCKFDRKNYFYPDLPKAYQVSQLYSPICRNGYLEIETEAGQKIIRISEIHMEEDAGKLIHDKRDGTLMDFNRCGTPLLEIVTEPDFENEVEVLDFLEKMREILVYLNICDGKMQEGSLRCDINLSVKKEGAELGVRTEMKNLNSFKAVARAIGDEALRQTQILSRGGFIVQETRRWDDDNGLSYAMRSKENAQDYRYFPEPDLLPLNISEAWLSEIKKSLPELAHEKRSRYQNDHGITPKDTFALTEDKSLADLFDDVIKNGADPQESAHLICGEIKRLLNTAGLAPKELRIDAKKLAQLVNLVIKGEINRSAYKETVEAVFNFDVCPLEYIETKGLRMQNDDNLIKKAAAYVLEENPGAVSDYRSGKDKALGFLIGQTMKELKGTGNPGAVKKVLLDYFEA